MFLTKYFGDKVFFKHFALVLSQPWRAIKNGEQIIILISVKLNKTAIEVYLYQRRYSIQIFNRSVFVSETI